MLHDREFAASSCAGGPRAINLLARASRSVIQYSPFHRDLMDLDSHPSTVSALATSSHPLALSTSSHPSTALSTSSAQMQTHRSHPPTPASTRPLMYLLTHPYVPTTPGPTNPRAARMRVCGHLAHASTGTTVWVQLQDTAVPCIWCHAWQCNNIIEYWSYRLLFYRVNIVRKGE